MKSRSRDDLNGAVLERLGLVSISGLNVSVNKLILSDRNSTNLVPVGSYKSRLKLHCIPFSQSLLFSRHRLVEFEYYKALCYLVLTCQFDGVAVHAVIVNMAEISYSLVNVRATIQFLKDFEYRVSNDKPSLSATAALCVLCVAILWCNNK